MDGTSIVVIVLIIYFTVLFGSDGVAKILSARKSKQLEIEKEITEQKRLDLEIAKINAGLPVSTEG